MALHCISSVWQTKSSYILSKAEAKRRTVVAGHAAGDLHQNPCVAEDHDDQRQQEQAHKREHVVDGLLPVLDKAAVGGALGEVLWHRNGDIVEDEDLQIDGKEDKVVILDVWSCQDQTRRSFVGS